MNKPKRLLDKRALITGGSSGIGLAIAQAFVAEGAEIVISGRNIETLKDAVEAIGPTSHLIVADLRSIKQVGLLLDKTHQKIGKLDIVVANAGVAKAAPLDLTDEDLFSEIIDTNIKGTYFTIQKSLPYLNKGASVILVSSAVSHVGLPGLSVYGASKAAIRSLSRSFSAELMDREIRVNTLSPGPIDTPIFDKMGVNSEDLSKHIENDIPLKRMGKPHEIGLSAVFLASDESKYMVGSELIIDGGHSQI